MSIILTAVAIAAAQAAPPATAAAPLAPPQGGHAQHQSQGEPAKAGCCCDKTAKSEGAGCCAKMGEGQAGEHFGKSVH